MPLIFLKIQLKCSTSKAVNGWRHLAYKDTVGSSFLHSYPTVLFFHGIAMPLGNALNLLLVRTSTNLAVSSLLQLCSGDNVQLSKELLFMHVGRDIGLSLPERYLSFILVRHNLSTLTSVSLSYQCFPSTKACRSLGQSLSAVTSQPTIKEVSLHQLSLNPQNLVELIHSFLETPSSHQQKMLLSELCLVQHQMDLHPPEYEEWPCEGCKLLKSLTIISTRLSVEIISWLLQYGHIHFKELHLDNVESDSLSLLYTSPNFQCEHLVLESCVFGNPLTGFRSLLSNTSLKSLEISELIHSDFLEDITCGLKNQSGIGTLEELNLISCTMGGKGDRKIRDFFAALFDLPQLEKFTLMLQYPKLQLSDLHSMVHCWKKIKRTQ